LCVHAQTKGSGGRVFCNISSISRLNQTKIF